ncbi:MAG: CBS domain-containing protein [Burkholderiaceae bacterium]|nr:CBS domain-containing protein [Burkholderiaceae bacterium]
MLIREVMSAPVVTIAPAATLRQALDVMHLRGIHHLPVCEDGNLVGIVAEHDLLLAAANFGTTELPVAEIMKRPVTCIGADSTVQQAARVLARKRIRSLPVRDRRKNLVGIVTETDLFKLLAGLHPAARTRTRKPPARGTAKKGVARARR